MTEPVILYHLHQMQLCIFLSYYLGKLHGANIKLFRLRRSKLLNESNVNVGCAQTVSKKQYGQKPPLRL